MMLKTVSCIAVLTSLALVAVLVCAVQAIAQTKPQPAAPPDADFSAWLVRIQYCHRLDHAPETAERIAELQARRDAAATPAERRKIEREIDKVEADADDQRPHVIYGWSMQADDTGKPLSSTRSMTGFILPATPDNNKAIAAVPQDHERGKPAVIAFERKGSKDLFTFDGRRWHRVDRAATLAKPPAMPEPGAFHIPPNTPMTDEQRRAVAVSLKHERSETSSKGSTLHRYWIQIQADQPPATASRLRVWIAASVEIDGQRIGPIIDDIEVPKSSKGGFQQMQSFEFIALPGVNMNPKATTAEPLTIAWE